MSYKIRRIARARDKRADMMLQEAIVQSDLPPLHAETHRPTGIDPILPSDIGAETPQGAQQRADRAENNAKSYTDVQFGIVEQNSRDYTDNLKTYIEANYQPVISFPTASRPLDVPVGFMGDRKSTRLNSSHVKISYAVFCLKKKITIIFY